MCTFARGILPLVLFCSAPSSLCRILLRVASLLCWSCFLLAVVVAVGPSLSLQWYQEAAGCCAYTFFCDVHRPCGGLTAFGGAVLSFAVARCGAWRLTERSEQCSGMGCLLSPAVDIPRHPFASGTPLLVVGIGAVRPHRFSRRSWSWWLSRRPR